MMNVYKFEIEYGRSGTLSGMFIADSDAVAEVVGKEVYFGDVLGKYSDVLVKLEDGDIELIPLEEESIADLFSIFADDKEDKNVTIVGYNPFDYIEDID